MKISVAIPCYNSARYIGETIESVLAQTRPPDEITVADDCSTDTSREVVSQYRQVTLVTQAKNSGCAAARNLAIRASTGDVIAIVDADDVWYADHLDATVGLLERQPSIGMAFSGVRRFGLASEDRLPDVTPQVPLQLHETLLAGNMIPQPTAVFRRGLYDAVGGFDESFRYCEDYDLWLKLSRVAPAAATGRITAGYRLHEGQLNRHHPQMFAATWRARLNLLERVRDEDPDEESTLQQRLSEVWRDGLYAAWAFRSRESLDFMLTLADHFPNQHHAARAWRRRRKFWPLLVGVDHVSALLPRRLRQAARSPWSSSDIRRPAI
jgi:glycosyltransferase involved in cell wall biosynthesis